MSNEVEILLLSVERDRLSGMIEELEEKFGFDWNSKTCPVCREATEYGDCEACYEFEIADRCDYINGFWEKFGVRDEDYGIIVFSRGEIDYLQDLFANYIRQINDRLEELKP